MVRTILLLINILFGAAIFSQTPQQKQINAQQFYAAAGISIISSELSFQLNDRMGLSCAIGIGSGLAYTGLRRLADKKYDCITSGWGNILGTVGIACYMDFRKRKRKEIKDAYKKS